MKLNELLTTIVLTKKTSVSLDKLNPADLKSATSSEGTFTFVDEGGDWTFTISDFSLRSACKQATELYKKQKSTSFARLNLVKFDQKG